MILDVLAKLLVAVVVVPPNGRLFESTVYPLDLTIRPRMIWLCQPMLNPVRAAEQEAVMQIGAADSKRDSHFIAVGVGCGRGWM